MWTSVPIYLIQPPSVFQFTSLLFSHHHISDRIRELTVHLPPDCYNTSALSCHGNDNITIYLNNRFLDVLTNEVSSMHNHCYPAHMCRGKAINVIAKIANSRNLGVWATCKRDQSVEIGEKLP